MASGYKARGGGVNPLNFKVVGGTSAPSNPKENTIWVNCSLNITSWDFSATEPQRRSNNRNMLAYPFDDTTLTYNNVTFTDNGDGTIKVNGTATGNCYFRIRANGSMEGTNNGAIPFRIPSGTYTLSGNGNTDAVRLNLGYSYDGTTVNWVNTNANKSVTFILDKTALICVRLQVLSGSAISNATIKPQLERGSTATSFIKGVSGGQVWFKTGTSSPAEFNTLKKNGISVYPISTYQWNGSAWISRVAKNYKSGAWVDFMYYVFKEGTGYCNGHTGFTNASATSSEITMTLKSSNSNTTYSNSNETVDVTPYKTATFEGVTASFSGSSGFYQKAWLYVGTANAQIGEGISGSSGTFMTNGKITIDVSSLTGKVSVRGAFQSSKDNGTVTGTIEIKNIYFS